MEVFTGSSIFAEDAYWNVSATVMRRFGCLQYLYWSVSGDDWVRALVENTSICWSMIDALARFVWIHGVIALSSECRLGTADEY